MFANTPERSTISCTMESPTSRRSFIASAAALSAGAIAATAASSASYSSASAKSNYPKVIHHVFFWLKNPDSKEDLAQLLAGIKSLGAIETVKGIHVGVAADTEQRGVVDGSYSASELLFFDDVEGEKIYQAHPLHQKFVEENANLWSKVAVYDSVSV
jgi:hypothetical protein